MDTSQSKHAFTHLTGNYTTRRLDPQAGYKPLDFGGGQITGTVKDLGN